MSELAKTRILVKLDADWAARQKGNKKSPIDMLISTFAGNDPDIVLVQHDEISCTFETFYASGRKEELEDQLACALQDGLDIEPSDHVAQWEIIVSENGFENQPSDKALTPEELCAMIPETAWRIHIELDDKWVLARRTDAVLPIEKFLAAFCKAFRYSTIERESLTKCSVIVNTENGQEIEEKLQTIIQETEIQEAMIKKAIEAMEDIQNTETAERAEEKLPETSKTPTYRKIERLIGAEGFRVLAQELIAVTPQIVAHQTIDSFRRRSYLFSISDGCGLSTQLEHLTLLLNELRLFESDKRVVEVPADKSLPEMLEEVSGSYLSKTLICFDISRWMDKIRQPDFREFLQQLQSVAKRPIYVFRIPFVDEATRRKVLAGLGDVLTTQEVVTYPYTIEEFKQYASELLAEKGFSMEEDGWQQFERRIIAEKSDGQFYGLNTVRKIVDELFYQKHLSVVRAADTYGEKTITAKHVPDAVGAAMDTRPALEQLDDLIGIDAIRERLLEVMAQIEVAGTDQTLRPSLHMRFIGGPGTGKTTIARILGQMMKERGLLSKGQFFEYAGRDFCGQYIGETAPKTAAMCRDAYGSVLFIDEAYSLYRGDKDNKDYGREAIDTLIAQMENHRQDFMVIMAGYEDDMSTMMEGNVGLASRMPYTIVFPNYGRTELFQIFMKMAARSFDYEPELEAVVKNYFDSIGEDVLKSKDFANARFVRNLFERTWGKASVRRQLERDAPFRLCACDFDKAAADREFQELQKKNTRRIGF